MGRPRSRRAPAAGGYRPAFITSALRKQRPIVFLLAGMLSFSARRHSVGSCAGGTRSGRMPFAHAPLSKAMSSQGLEIHQLASGRSLCRGPDIGIVGAAQPPSVPDLSPQSETTARERDPEDSEHHSAADVREPMDPEVHPAHRNERRHHQSRGPDPHGSSPSRATCERVGKRSAHGGGRSCVTTRKRRPGYLDQLT